MGAGTIVFFIIIGVVLIYIASGVRIIRQSTACVVERLGKYNRTLSTGPHFIWPILEKVGERISLKELVGDFNPQPVITKDNVTIQIDTIVYFHITDPKLYTYGVHNPVSAIEKLTATTIRNIVGEMELDETLTSRETVNTKMRLILDEATDPWGIKITRVELKNIIPPRDIQDAMEKQMRAERERREAILKAEGEKKSNILVAEGEKQAAILRAEAKQATLIAEAEGQSQAIAMICKAKPTQEYLTLQGYEALAKLADGQSTKIIVPSNIQDIAGLFASLKEVVSDSKKK